MANYEQRIRALEQQKLDDEVKPAIVQIINGKPSPEQERASEEAASKGMMTIRIGVEDASKGADNEH